MAHLFVDISTHGLGHLAQAAPVLNALHARRPDVRLTVRSGVSLERLEARLRVPFTHIAGQSDFGFAMLDAVRIDAPATARRYREQHADWPGRVRSEADALRRLRPDLVLSDVAYLPLAGAAEAGIAALSMCSLNWADLFAHVFGHETWAPRIHAEILAAYRSARRFLRLTPAMPMPDLPNARAVAPVAALGRDCRQELRTRSGAKAGERLVLIAFGGFDKELNAGHWPVTAGVRWLVPESWSIARADMVALESLRLPFSDLLCSVDAVLTKPGYGTFTEAACNGTAVLFVRRDDWPEQDCLIDWLEKNARCAEVNASALMAGQLQPALAQLWHKDRPDRPHPGGAAEAAAIIAAYLP